MPNVLLWLPSLRTGFALLLDLDTADGSALNTRAPDWLAALPAPSPPPLLLTATDPALVDLMLKLGGVIVWRLALRLVSWPNRTVKRSRSWIGYGAAHQHRNLLEEPRHDHRDPGRYRRHQCALRAMDTGGWLC